MQQRNDQDSNFHIYFFIKNYYSASIQSKSIKDLPNRCTLHCSSVFTMLDCKGYILRILLKILISEESKRKKLLFIHRPFYKTMLI